MFHSTPLHNKQLWFYTINTTQQRFILQMFIFCYLFFLFCFFSLWLLAVIQFIQATLALPQFSQFLFRSFYGDVISVAIILTVGII